MKSIKSFIIAAGIVAGMSSCAMVSSPLTGGLYTNVNAPVAATSNSVGSKVGTAEAKSILGIIATGDASINAAAKKAGISKISHVDYEGTSILGIIAKYKVYVYGE